jgi:ABC-type branched-subunit amino acid transport system substrate-binding protein
VKLKRLLALLMAFGLVAAACGDSDDDDSADGGDTDTTEAADSGGDDAGDDDGDDGDDGGDPAEVASDFGVVDNTIRIGINADLSGPFASLVTEIVEAQTVYWEWVNENGGVDGYQIELEIKDSGYATDKGIENYEELAQESEEGVLMISENTGSPITAAVAEDAIDDDMLLIPLSWASLWPANSNVLGKQSTYCAEGFNAISYLAAKAEADGEEPKLAILSRPGEYGLDGAVGAALAAEELGIEVVYDGTDQVAGDDRTAVISQLVGSGANIVWLTTTGGETLDIFGNAVSQGFEAYWSGNSPSFDYKIHLASDFAAEFDEYWTHSTYQVGWNGNDSEAMQDMVREMSARRPELPLSDVYSIGWIEGLMVEQILEQAIANGDLTRAGVVQAASEIEIDFKGIAPNQAFFGDFNDIVVRETYMFDVDATAFDLQPMSAGAGSTGLFVEEGPFISDVLADYEFDGPCV